MCAKIAFFVCLFLSNTDLEPGTPWNVGLFWKAASEPYWKTKENLFPVLTFNTGHHFTTEQKGKPLSLLDFMPVPLSSERGRIDILQGNSFVF